MPLIVMVTVPKKDIPKLVSAILRPRLCACVNIIKGVKSFFWWKGKIEKADETILLMKTEKKLFTKLKKAISTNHPYDVPEIIAFDISKGNQEYLNWIKDSCQK